MNRENLFTNAQPIWDRNSSQISCVVNDRVWGSLPCNLTTWTRQARCRQAHLMTCTWHRCSRVTRSRCPPSATATVVVQFPASTVVSAPSWSCHNRLSGWPTDSTLTMCRSNRHQRQHIFAYNSRTHTLLGHFTFWISLSLLWSQRKAIVQEGKWPIVSCITWKSNTDCSCRWQEVYKCRYARVTVTVN